MTEKPTELELEVKKGAYPYLRLHNFQSAIDEAVLKKLTSQGIEVDCSQNSGDLLALGIAGLACRLCEKYDPKEVNKAMRDYISSYRSR